MIKRLKEKCNIWLFKVFEKQILKSVLQEPPKIVHQLYEPIIITREYAISREDLYRTPWLGDRIVEDIKQDILREASGFIELSQEVQSMYYGGNRKVIGKLIIQKEKI